MKYLLFRGYPAGLNNNRMSLELGVGLAHLTGRTLVCYNTERIQNSSPDPRLRISPDTPTIIDLFEVPVEQIGLSQFSELSAGLRTKDAPVRELVDSVIYCPRQEPLDPVDFLHFRNGRSETFVLEDGLDTFDVLHVSANTLGYYSHLFYLPAPVRHGFSSRMKSVRPRAPFLEFTAEVAQRLGQFNAIHVRRGDFVTWEHSKRTREVTGRDILNNIRDLIPRNETLVICTDESWNADFFAPILSEYRDVVFVDRLILEEQTLAEEFSSLPFAGDIALALVCQLVMVHADIFVGTMFSTYTGLIHRMRGLKYDEERFFFLYSQFDGNVPFERCELVPTRSGPYSWNRYRLPLSPGAFSWFREWPESFGA